MDFSGRSISSNVRIRHCLNVLPDVGCCLGLARLTVIEYLVARCEDHDSG